MDPKIQKGREPRLDFYERVVKVGERWVKLEFMLLIIAVLPNEARLPNE